MTAPSDYWIGVWNGLPKDPEHRTNMGPAVWLYLCLLDRANKRTGVVNGVTAEKLAQEFSMSRKTVEKHLSRLRDHGYIKTTCYGQGSHIMITKYRPFGIPKTEEPKGHKSFELLQTGEPKETDYSKQGKRIPPNGGSQNILDNIQNEKNIPSFLKSAEFVYQHYKDTVRPGAKTDAVKSIIRLLSKEQFTPERLLTSIDHYKQSPGFSIDKQYRIQANNFFGQARRFEEYLEPPENNNLPDDVPEEWHKSARQRKKEMGLI